MGLAPDCVGNGWDAGAESVNKYRAIKTTVDGITFDSKAEARRYRELRTLEKAGAIRGLELQPEFPITARNGERVATYRADFAYLEEGQRVIEDVKSSPTRTPVYRLKKKLVEAEHGVVITEVS